MKVGTSLSRCIVDIYTGKVKESEVLVIVARTNFDPMVDNEWDNIWEGYTRDVGWTVQEWTNFKDKETEFRELITRMYNQGKIHQPRKFGTFVTRTPYYWYDLILTPDVIETVPSAKRAWENYKLIAGLSE